MAIRIEAELNANTKQAQKEVDELNEKVKEVGKSAKKSGQAISTNLAVAKPIIRELDRYSGGLATKLIDVGAHKGEFAQNALQIKSVNKITKRLLPTNPHSSPMVLKI